jgi:hypothetical protein
VISSVEAPYILIHNTKDMRTRKVAINEQIKDLSGIDKLSLSREIVKPPGGPAQRICRVEALF